jgi:2Fe-2S ferredoxin
MLENTLAERRPASRLSCEIQIKPEYDGLTVHLPERQI